jgi:hypothetical protein
MEAALASNYHFRNNLMLAWQPSETLFSVDSYTNYTSSDFNGFRPDPGAEYSFVWKSPPFDIIRGYSRPRVERKFTTLEEYSKDTGQDKNSILVDYDIFQKVAQPDPNDVTRIYRAKNLDFRLKENTAAVDAGCILPNINDNFTGKAPDLGALEVGQPLPIYGPRP